MNTPTHLREEALYVRTPSLPDPDPANDATREKQIPFRHRLLSAIACLLLLAVPSHAQINSVRVLTDAGTGNANPSVFGISGMELRGPGLFWWKYGATGEINNYQATLGIKPSVSKFSPTLDRSSGFYMIRGGDFISGAERDGSYAYTTGIRGGIGALFRQPLGSAENATRESLIEFPSGPLASMGPLGRSGSDLYFAPSHPNGYTVIWRASFNDAGDYTGAGAVAAGFLNASPVRNLLFFEANITGTVAKWGLCLQASGALWRFGPLGTPNQPMVLLRSDVNDIGVRSEDGGPSINIIHDGIYAATSGPAGKLMKISAVTGEALAVYYTAPGVTQVRALGFDKNFLFISSYSAPVNSPPTGEIQRRFAPYLWHLPNPLPGSPTGWDTIEAVSGTNGGTNLRSDGRWLYFTRGNEIRRVATDVPPIIVDIHAFGVEAVQIVQDFNNSVPLIAGKPVLVRGYARLAANSLSNPTRQPTAVVNVVRNNVVVGTYYPENRPLISAVSAAQLFDYRSAPIGSNDSTQSFNFVIPAEVVQSGTMTFTFQINGTRSIVETGVANPYGNNSITTPSMQVVTTGTPRLFCMPVRVDNLIYTLDTDPPAFWNQIGRAISLLPIPDIHVYSVDAVIEKPVVRVGIPPVVYRSFDLPDNEDAVMNWIRLEITSSGNYFKGGDTHFLGMVDPGIEGDDAGGIFNGMATRPGEVLVVRMNGKNGTNAWDSSRGGQTLAHELGHNYGLTHVNFASNGPAPKDTNGEYPYPVDKMGPEPNTSREAAFGWDPISRAFINGTATGDLMSYHQTRWLSPYSLNRLRGLIASENGNLAASPFAVHAAGKAHAAGIVAGDVILISGMVNTIQARVELWPAHVVPAGTYDPASVADSIARAAQPQGHNYLVSQLDASGGNLSTSPLLLERTGDGFGEKIGFVQFLEASPGAVALRILNNNGGAILAQLNASSSVPVVAANVPTIDAAAQLLNWSWSAADADGDPLFSNVHYSRDGGANWLPMKLLSGNSSIALDLRKLPGGAQCLLRVVVSDGFNTTLATTAPFSLPIHAPEITIIGAAEGAKLPFGSQAELQAFAMDAEEGSLASINFGWVLSGPEERIKPYRNLSLSGLPPGSYSAGVQVIDASGSADAKTLNFEVLPVSVPETAAPVLDGEVDDEAYSSGPSMRWAYGGVSPISARLTRSGGRLYVAFTDLPYRTFGSTPFKVGLRVDVDGSADATVQSSDLGFFVDEDGRPTQLEGNGTSMVPRATPAAGFDSAINTGELNWTAEFCLPEAILGGGEHGIRIMLSMDGFLHTAWPVNANPLSPATWAPVQLGDLPPPANVPPIAYAGANRIVEPTEALTIVLDGSGSIDPEGQPLTYQWTQVGGAAVSLSGANTSQPSFSINPATVTNVRRFQLVVNDGELDSSAATVSVTSVPVVPPSPPRALPHFTRYPDGTVEGYFTPDDFGLFDVGTAPVGAGGGFSIGTQGLYTIETSEDLLAWTPLFDTGPDLLGRLIFTDLSSTGLPRHFYRPRLLGADGLLAPGNALEFDGALRYVRVPHSDALNAYPMTISAWIKTTNTASQLGGIVSKYALGAIQGWYLVTLGGRVRGAYIPGHGTQVRGESIGLDGGFIADGAWHHVVMTIGPAGGTMYVDGAARDSLSWTGIPTNCTTPVNLQIGRHSTLSFGFVGQIDEVSAWSAEFSGLQVLDLLRRAPSGQEANLEALWKLDEGTGTEAADSSTRGLPRGTLLGSPQWVPSTAPIRR